MLAAAPDVGGALCLMSFTTRCIGAALLWVGSGKNSVRRSPSTSLTRSRLQTFTSPLSALPGSSNSRSGKLKLCRRRIHEGLGRRQPIQLVDYQPMRRSLVMATAAARSWRALAFSAGGDGGRRAPEHSVQLHTSFAAASDCRTLINRPAMSALRAFGASPFGSLLMWS